MALVFCSDDPTSAPQDAAVPDTGVADTEPKDASGDGGGCGPRKEGTIAELNDPSSPKRASVGDGVHLTNAIATSTKIFIRKSNGTGTCTYGVFVADRATTFRPYSGILITETVKAVAVEDSGKFYCTGAEPTGFPADLALGDLLDVSGVYGLVGADTCMGTMPVPPSAPEVDALCGLTRVGKAPPLLPADVLPSDIGGGSPEQLKWAGGLVRVKNVTAKEDLDKNGHFLLKQSDLQVDDFFYFAAWGRPTVVANQPFDAIVGVSFLDYCTWSLMPRTICELTPVPRPAGSLPPCP
jgi:hypothetical protein